MIKIDTHQHFWTYNDRDYGWMGPGMETLKRDRLPEHLKPLLEEAGVDGTVAVQARQTLEETEWLLRLADENPFIKAVVGWVDLRGEGLRQELERLAGRPRFRGVRHVIHDEPNDRFMGRESFQNGIGLLAEFNLTYDLLVRPRHLAPACELVEKFPNQMFIVDHIAKPLIKDGVMAPWDAHIRRLAEYDNVYCKVSGMVTEADWAAWKPSDFVPYMDVVFEAFGAERITLGSDWPVCTVAGEYGEVMRVAAAYVDRLSPDERAAVWGGNARRFYGIQ